MVVYCSLTQEQADLYEKVVSETLTILDQSEGIQRRGLVLGLLTKLKQICNHPAHYLKQEGPLVGRSSKLNRLTEMLEEVLAVGDSALVFTQFVEMGDLLQRHIIETFKAETLFLHGRTPAAQRERMVMAFQEAETPTIFILSLRAGGAGINLTRANHVTAGGIQRWRARLPTAPSVLVNDAMYRCISLSWPARWKSISINYWKTNGRSPKWSLAAVSSG